MKVLLLGGTGAIGGNLVKILQEHKIAAVITSRKNRRSHDSIKYVKGDAHDYSFVKQLCSEKWDAVVDFMSYKTEEFEKRVDLLLSCTAQYIYISSARVYADDEHPIKETSPRLLDVIKDEKYLLTDEYALTKARQENVLKNHSISNNYTIVRPYITYSTNRLQLGVLEKEEWLYRALCGHTIVFTEAIAAKITTMTDGYDVAEGIYNLIGNRDALGETFHITSEQLRTWSDILNIYSSTFKEITGKEFKVKMVSVQDFVKCRLKGLEYQVIYDRLYNRDFDVAKGTKLVGSINFKSPEQGLRKCLMNFLKGSREFISIDFVHEAKKDKLTGECFPLSSIPGYNNKLKYIINRFML